MDAGPLGFALMQRSTYCMSFSLESTVQITFAVGKLQRVDSRSKENGNMIQILLLAVFLHACIIGAISSSLGDGKLLTFADTPELLASDAKLPKDSVLQSVFVFFRWVGSFHSRSMQDCASSGCCRRCCPITADLHCTMTPVHGH